MTGVQAKAITGRTFSSVYVHAGMIGLDGEKMSKSRGNLVFVSDLLKNGVDSNALRIALQRNFWNG
jgi:L-cysteine:1D-myo-inositol 2-amino-2-deoxy-alpha-D-glucopyranoside ligase